MPTRTSAGQPRGRIAYVNRSTERILTTHTGKLFMPDAGNPGMGPPPTPPDRVEYEINELVKKQVEIGMDIISNGEPAGIGPGTIFRLVEGFETINPNIPDDEPHRESREGSLALARHVHVQRLLRGHVWRDGGPQPEQSSARARVRS